MNQQIILSLEETEKLVQVLGQFPAGKVYETLKMLELKTIEALKPKEVTNEN